MLLISFTQWESSKELTTKNYQGTKIEVNLNSIEYVIELDDDNMNSQIGLTSGKKFNLVETQSQVKEKIERFRR